MIEKYGRLTILEVLRRMVLNMHHVFVIAVIKKIYF